MNPIAQALRDAEPLLVTILIASAYWKGRLVEKRIQQRREDEAAAARHEAVQEHLLDRVPCILSAPSPSMPPPNLPAELQGGPHDGLRLEIWAHTHEVMMGDHCRYAFSHDRVTDHGSVSVFTFAGTAPVHA